MRHQLSTIFLLLTLLLTIAACTGLDIAAETGDTGSAADPTTLVIASHDSFSISEELVSEFQDEHDVALRFLQLGDAGEALNKMILSKDAPLADVFYGVDNTFLSRALGADIFEQYDSPLLDTVADSLKLDPDSRLLPVNFGYINLNADRTWFEERDITMPQTLADLTDPTYAGLLVVQNPATSSPGLAFLLATIAHFGEDSYEDFWNALRTNDVLVTPGWSEAYYEHFTVGSGGAGDRPLVVSYTTSPPADVLYAVDGRTEPASANINPPQGTFRQIEFAGIVSGTEQRALAEKFIDLMLSRELQSELPLQMFVYPTTDVSLPELFVTFAEIPADPAELDPTAIEENRERWIAAWTEIMLR